MSDVKSKTRDYLGTVKTVSLATCMDDKPSCRIMEIQKVDDDLKIWFVTHKSSPKVEQIDKNNSACILSPLTMRHLKTSGFLERSKSLKIWKQRNTYGKKNLPRIFRVV